ncbi:MAG: hypothetical protein LBE12_14260 [Planctomycetaceae bacterium]|jgi:hypothetical protein|nr:hypothetical protein [Planctomycetaceae bacterium]
MKSLNLVFSGILFTALFISVSVWGQEKVSHLTLPVFTHIAFVSVIADEPEDKPSAAANDTATNDQEEEDEESVTKALSLDEMEDLEEIVAQDEEFFPNLFKGTITDYTKRLEQSGNKETLLHLEENLKPWYESTKIAQENITVEELDLLLAQVVQSRKAVEESEKNNPNPNVELVSLGTWEDIANDFKKNTQAQIDKSKKKIQKQATESAKNVGKATTKRVNDEIKKLEKKTTSGTKKTEKKVVKKIETTGKSLNNLSKKPSKKSGTTSSKSGTKSSTKSSKTSSGSKSDSSTKNSKSNSSTKSKSKSN